jgi:hypothetical protein
MHTLDTEILGVLFSGLQTIVIITAAILAWVNIIKLGHSRGIDFVINAESTIDPLRHSLLGADPTLIRNIYSNFDLSKLSDDDCRAFPFMQSLYSHVSRMCFLMTNSRIDLGLSKSARQELIRVQTHNQ